MAPTGPEAIKGTVCWLRAAFPDLDYQIDAATATATASRCAALRCTVRGTHKRDFLGQTPTERRFEIQQIHIYRVQDGRIAEHWACRDDVAMFHQLGLTG